MNLVVVVESTRTIVTHKASEETNALHVPSLIAVAAALGQHTLFFLLSFLSFLSTSSWHAGKERADGAAFFSRRQVPLVSLLLALPQGVQPSRSPLGRPP